MVKFEWNAEDIWPWLDAIISRSLKPDFQSIHPKPFMLFLKDQLNTWMTFPRVPMHHQPNFTMLLVPAVVWPSHGPGDTSEPPLDTKWCRYKSYCLPVFFHLTTKFCAIVWYSLYLELWVIAYHQDIGTHWPRPSITQGSLIVDRHSWSCDIPPHICINWRSILSSIGTSTKKAHNYSYPPHQHLSVYWLTGSNETFSKHGTTSHITTSPIFLLDAVTIEHLRWCRLIYASHSPACAFRLDLRLFQDLSYQKSIQGTWPGPLIVLEDSQSQP